MVHTWPTNGFNNRQSLEGAMVFNYLLPVILANQGWPSQNYFFWSGLRTVKKSCSKNALIIVRIVNASLTSMMREKKKLDCQMICFYRKECFCNLNFSITLANCVRGLRRRLTCYISNKITNWQTTAQCPRCQIGCSCSKNLPSSNYRHCPAGTWTRPATRYFFRYPTRFSFRNHRVAGNPKHRVFPDISGKPQVSGINQYFGYF